MTGSLTQHLPAGHDRAHRGGVERPMSIEAMRAAVIAVRAGVFDGPVAADEATVGAVPEGTPAGWFGATLGGPAVVLLAGHAGAGSSTVALALAESLCGARTVQLVECAPRHRSGLVAASSVELGVDEAGWRCGRRGSVELARPAGDVLPPRPPASRARGDAGSGDRMVVVDGGLATDPLILAGRSRELTDPAGIVVVTRPTVPGLRQTEHVLASIGVPAIVAVVGSRRWSRAVAASCGPAVREARGEQRMVVVPLDRRLATSGLTPDPLPRAVAAAGRALAGLLRAGWADRAPATAHPNPPVAPVGAR